MLAQSKDWNNDVCTVGWLTCRSGKNNSLLLFISENHLQFKSGPRVFGFISASLLCYLHSSGWLTHSCPRGWSRRNFMSLLKNLRKEVFYLVLEARCVLWNETKKESANSWLARWSRKKKRSYFKCWGYCMIYSEQAAWTESRREGGVSEWVKEWPQTLKSDMAVTTDSVICQFVQMRSRFSQLCKLWWHYGKWTRGKDSLCSTSARPLLLNICKHYWICWIEEIVVAHCLHNIRVSCCSHKEQHYNHFI